MSGLVLLVGVVGFMIGCLIVIVVVVTLWYQIAKRIWNAF